MTIGKVDVAATLRKVEDLLAKDKYDCIHCLCNAHHIRELTRAFEHDNQAWAKQMQALLETINRKALDSGGVLTSYMQRKFIKQYRNILAAAEEECPPPDDSRKKGQKGRIKRTKSRNLLKRLRDFEDDVLRFMTIAIHDYRRRALHQQSG